MEVNWDDCLAIGVPVRRRPDAEPNEGDNLASAELVRALDQINAGPPQIENEVLAPGLGQKGDCHPSPAPRVGPRAKIHAKLRKGDEAISFSLSQFCFGH